TNPGGGNFASPSWTRLGSGEPCGTYTFSNQPATGAFYALSVPAGLSAGPVFLTNFTFYISPNQGTMAQFDVAGGVSNALYDVLTSTNLGDPANGGWTWLAQG